MPISDDVVTRKEYELLQGRVDALWQRTVAAETLLTLAISRLVSIDEETAASVETIFAQYESGQASLSKADDFTAFHSEKVLAYVLSLLLQVNQTLTPPLLVPQGVKELIESALKDQT